MRRAIIVLSTVIAAAVLVPAQEYTPKVELGLGYSYSRAHVPDTPARVNMHGLVLGATGNVNGWFAIEAEFGTHYHCISGCWSPWGERVDNPDERNDSLSFLAGPKFSFSRQRISPWVHALVGVSKVSYTNNIDGTRISNSGCAMAAGGGLDVALSRFTVRAIQLDYTRFSASPGTFNSLRVGVGVVLRIGRRS
jgi:opacity protein-like surface antigen